MKIEPQTKKTRAQFLVNVFFKFWKNKTKLNLVDLEEENDAKVKRSDLSDRTETQ